MTRQLIDTCIFEDDNYLIKLCIGVFVCLSKTVKEKDINGITSAINNLHLYIPDPGKIICEADKLKLSSNKINDMKTAFKARVSANF